MAQLSVKYFSQALNRNIRFEMYIPNDKPEDTPKKMRTLFLRHGGFPARAEPGVPPLSHGH